MPASTSPLLGALPSGRPWTRSNTMKVPPTRTSPATRAPCRIRMPRSGMSGSPLRRQAEHRQDHRQRDRGARLDEIAEPLCLEERRARRGVRELTELRPGDEGDGGEHRKHEPAPEARGPIPNQSQDHCASPNREERWLLVDHRFSLVDEVGPFDALNAVLPQIEPDHTRVIRRSPVLQCLHTRLVQTFFAWT